MRQQQQQQPGEGRSDRASKDMCMVIMSSAALCMAYGVIQSGKFRSCRHVSSHGTNPVDPTLLQFDSFPLFEDVK